MEMITSEIFYHDYNGTVYLANLQRMYCRVETQYWHIDIQYT